MNLSFGQRGTSGGEAPAERPFPRVVVAGLLGVAIAWVISVAQMPGFPTGSRNGSWLEPWTGERGAATAEPVPAGAAHHSSAVAPVSIDATIASLSKLGIRRIAVCATPPSPLLRRSRDPRASKHATITEHACDGGARSIEASVASIAAVDPQAVIFDGSTEDARALIEALRAQGSFALVVMTRAVDVKRLSQMLSSKAAVWLAVVEALPTSPGAPRDASAVRLGMLARSGVIVY